MSNGDDEEATSGDEEPEAADGDAEDGAEETVDVSAEELDERLDAVEEDLEAAETEADLDEVEAELDAVEEDLEAADLPEPDEDDEDAEDPRADLEARLEEVRGELEEARGPYAEDVVAEIESAQSTIEETEWTERGEEEVAEAVEAFLDDVVEIIGEESDPDFETEGADTESLVAALGVPAEAVEERALDPDEDEETIAALLEATDELAAGLEDAEEWDDLTVVQKLRAQGFYDRLTPENRKDFPPELTAVRVAEAEYDPERVLMALDYLTSDFMQENCIEALKRMGPAEAYDEMMTRAGKRDRDAIEVLGKIGDDRAIETLHDYIEGESNPPLQKTTLRALGEIGSEESTQPVADRLVAEEPEVRSAAANALGHIGDTRAISPLADVLADDEEDFVRAAAARALVAIGTERALEAAADYAGDRSYVVQVQAERAVEALGAEPEPVA